MLTKCPLKPRKTIVGKDRRDNEVPLNEASYKEEEVYDFGECIHKECAFWSTDAECCGILLLSDTGMYFSMRI
ncbi:hypothetical protein D2962_05970 [Biomaibacter acetigenes]|uniref:Uncharacterized protein n=1 Tax=Biomaibacter acetigenes TaxID=2316383 RepID=A0A3G2R3Y3_9FIRM|nr:hypothetical protein [Biomaibacter acetigenes]AYO30224.1 hypothetical protein D2962_05970 [Biomaibacter acetigenes]